MFLEKLLLDLKALPKPLKCTDLISLLELTEVFARNTPTSFRIQNMSLLFSNANLKSLKHIALNPLCMFVQIQEVLEAQSLYLKDYGLVLKPSDDDKPTDSGSELRYLLVDCRPAEQYNAGHLPSAFFLDSSLILSDLEQFQQSVKVCLT